MVGSLHVQKQVASGWRSDGSSECRWGLLVAVESPFEAVLELVLALPDEPLEERPGSERGLEVLIEPLTELVVTVLAELSTLVAVHAAAARRAFRPSWTVAVVAGFLKIWLRMPRVRGLSTQLMLRDSKSLARRSQA